MGVAHLLYFYFSKRKRIALAFQCPLRVNAVYMCDNIVGCTSVKGSLVTKKCMIKIDILIQDFQTIIKK